VILLRARYKCNRDWGGLVYLRAEDSNRALAWTSLYRMYWRGCGVQFIYIWPFSVRSAFGTHLEFTKISQ